MKRVDRGVRVGGVWVGGWEWQGGVGEVIKLQLWAVKR